MTYMIRRFSLLLLTLGALAVFGTSPATAGVLYWSNASGGTSWSDAKWATTSGGTYNTAWSNGNDAQFEGTAGNVTTSATASAANLSFAVGSYHIVGSDSLTLTGGSVNATTGSTFIETAISSSAGLTKTGAGTLYLTGDNSSSYGTTTNSASSTLSVGVPGGSTGTLGSGNVVNNGTNLDFRRIDNTTVANVISGAGAIRKYGASTLTLSGSNSYTGAMKVYEGTVKLGSASALGTTAGTTTVYNFTSGMRGTIDLNGLALGTENITMFGVLDSTGGMLTNSSSTAASMNGTLTLTLDGLVGGTGDITLNGLLVGAGGLTKQAGNTLVLTATNNYTGVTTVSGGTLQLGNASAEGSVGTGNVVNNGVLSINRSNTYIMANAISGTGSLTKYGTNTLLLTGTNSYAGATTINGGAVRMMNASVLGSTAGGTTVNSGAALQLTGGITTPAEALTLNGEGITSTGALRSLDSSNIYAGLVTLGSDARVNCDAGTLTLSNTGAITGSGFNLTISGAGNTNIASSIATGTGGLNKYSLGTLTLSGSNSYSGTTGVYGGTLTLGAAGSLLMDVNPSGPFSQFLGTGALNLDGTMRLDVDDVVGNSGSWSLVDVASLTESYGGTFAVKMMDGSAFTNASGAWSYVDGLSRTWTFTESTGVLAVAEVPEPSTLALLATGLIGLIAYAWRKRK